MRTPWVGLLLAVMAFPRHTIPPWFCVLMWSYNFHVENRPYICLLTGICFERKKSESSTKEHVDRSVHHQILLYKSHVCVCWSKKNRQHILGQKRDAAHKTYIVYGFFSPISRKRFVTVWVLVLGVWVPGVVLAIIVSRRNWFSSLNLRFNRSWRRVIRRWRHECAWSYIVPICQKRFLRRSIILTWHRNCWGITDGVTSACNIRIAFSRSTCVRFGIVN